MGHFRPIQRVLSAGSCPLRPESVFEEKPVEALQTFSRQIPAVASENLTVQCSR
jgi:hypothetical protein